MYKHHLSDFVKVVDELSMKGWIITSGLTSEDGKVFQAMSKSPPDNNNVNRNKGSLAMTILQAVAG